MADDTVEAAKAAIIDDHYDGDCTREQLVAHLDALIAAVRAECETASDERAHKLRGLVDEVRAESATVRAELAELRRSWHLIRKNETR